MTIIDLFNSWPMPIKIIVGIIFFIWLIETLLLPFKINQCLYSMKHIESVLTQIMGQIEAYKRSDVDSKKLLEIFQTLLYKEKKEL